MAEDESLAEGLWRTVRRGLTMEDLSEGRPGCADCGEEMRRAGSLWTCPGCGARVELDGGGF